MKHTQQTILSNFQNLNNSLLLDDLLQLSDKYSFDFMEETPIQLPQSSFKYEKPANIPSFYEEQQQNLFPVKTKEVDDVQEEAKLEDQQNLATRCSSFFASTSTLPDDRLSTINGIDLLSTDRENFSLLSQTIRNDAGETPREQSYIKDSILLGRPSKASELAKKRESKSDGESGCLKSELIRKWHLNKLEYQASGKEKLPNIFQGVIGPKSNFIYEESIKRQGKVQVNGFSFGMENPFSRKSAAIEETAQSITDAMNSLVIASPTSGDSSESKLKRAHSGSKQQCNVSQVSRLNKSQSPAKLLSEEKKADGKKEISSRKAKPMFSKKNNDSRNISSSGKEDLSFSKKMQAFTSQKVGQSGYSTLQKNHQALFNTSSCIDLSQEGNQTSQSKEVKSFKSLQKDIMSVSVKNLKGFRKNSDGHQDGSKEHTELTEGINSGLTRATGHAKKLKLQFSKFGTEQKEESRNGEVGKNL